MKKANIDSSDVLELACKISNLDYDSIDADEDIIDNKLIEEFGCGLEEFTEIVSRLLPLIDVGESPISKKIYKGFSNIEQGCWLTKMEVNLK